MSFRFHQVNVFSKNAMLGNPLAVVSCSVEPTDEQMDRFAKWTNLSETTFLLPPKTPGTDYFVRIWTPTGELPFAGHPTLGTAHVWLGPNSQQEIVQECGVGKIIVRKSADLLAFKAPPCKFTPLPQSTLDAVLAGTGLNQDDILDAQILENGPVFHSVLVKSSALVAGVKPQWSKFGDANYVGLCAVRPDGDLEVRMLQGQEQSEDPITGSLNAALAMWLKQNGTLPGSYTARQGLSIGRDGLVIVDREGDDVWIGGYVQTVISGTTTMGI